VSRMCCATRLDTCNVCCCCTRQCCAIALCSVHSIRSLTLHESWVTVMRQQIASGNGTRFWYNWAGWGGVVGPNEETSGQLQRPGLVGRCREASQLRPCDLDDCGACARTPRSNH
jgi:hypothetical protein